MRVFNLLAGYSGEFLRRTRTPPVSLARRHFPRPTKQQLLAAVGNESFTSFLIARWLTVHAEGFKRSKSLDPDPAIKYQ